MKTTGTKSIVDVNNSNVLSKKNEPGLKRKSRWDRITGEISRKDLNSMKYYSICNSDASSLSNVRSTRTPNEQITNIDDEKIENKESGLKNSSYGLDSRSTSKCFYSIKNYFKFTI